MGVHEDTLYLYSLEKIVTGLLEKIMTGLLHIHVVILGSVPCIHIRDGQTTPWSSEPSCDMCDKKIMTLL